MVVQTTLLESDRTAIVQTPGTAEAATLLQEYLRMALDVTDGFEIVSESDIQDGDERILIALGQTKWIAGEVPEDLQRDGYTISRKENVIAICGGSDRGTFHGAAGFLDRFAGVRFYMPGGLWTSLPAEKQIAVPETLAIRSESLVTANSMSSPYYGDDWGARNAVGTRQGLTGTHQHNMNNVFPPERFAEKYPEIYPVIEGERYIPQDRRDQRWNPCFTSDQTIDAAEEMALAYFEENPEHYWFSMGLQDSHAHCECAGCREAFASLEKECLDILRAGNEERIVSTYTRDPSQPPFDRWARPYALSQLQWSLINRLAERLETSAPGKYVEAMSYGITSIAPRVELRPNVMIFMQIHVSDNIRGLMEPREDGTIPLDAFIDASPSAIGNHEWYRGTGYMVPRIYSGYWSKFIRHIAARGKTPHFQHAEAYANWGMDGIKYWVLARTWWDPEVDPETLWRQACDDLFGGASDEMYAYFSTLERWFMEQSVERGPKWKIDRFDQVFRRPEEAFTLMRTARAHLDAARARAGGPEVAERIALFDKTFRLTEEFAAIGMASLALMEGTEGDRETKEAAVTAATAERVDALWTHFNEQIKDDPMTIAVPMRDEEAFGRAIARVRYGRQRHP